MVHDYNKGKGSTRSTGVAGPLGYPAVAEDPVIKGPSRPSNAAAMAANALFGVAHLTKLVIVVEGKRIPYYQHFQLTQSATGHHHFTLILDHDSLGSAEDHHMEQVQKLMGKRILVTFSYKNVPTGSPERDFIGVITQVGLSRAHGNRGQLVLKGSSPTVLLDAAPHIQSFGGTHSVSLSAVARRMLEEGLGEKYPFRVAPNFTDNLTYSCQYDETHYNYLARMAESYGEQFYYDGTTVQFGKLPPPEKAIPLTFGKDVEEVAIELRTRHVIRQMYGYNSSNNELLTTGRSTVKHQSTLAKAAFAISEKTYHTPSLRIAPLKAITSKNVEAAQQSTTGSQVVDVFVTSGRTTVPFLYPGCVVDMNMRKPDSAEASYLTRLMITDVRHAVDTLGNYTGHFEGIAEGTRFLPGADFEVPIAEPQFATVTDNKDEQGRVQVKFDWQTGGTTTEWIRVMSPDAGGSDKVNKNRGFVFIPEVGDQVMVGFVHSHPDRPYVMGGLFHGKVGAGGGAGNNLKSLSSKSGNKLELNDKDGSVYLTDQGGANMKFDGGGNATTNANSNHTVNAGSRNVINVGAKKDTPPQSILKMDAAGNIMLDGKTSITFQVGGNKIVISKEGVVITAVEGKIEGTAEAGPVTIESKAADATFKGATAVTLQGADVAVNGDGTIKVSSPDTDIT